MATAREWLAAARPKTLGAAVAPVVLGTALAAAVIGGWVFDRLLHKAPKDAA